jgi:2-dehydropantoate 2-reductase
MRQVPASDHSFGPYLIIGDGSLSRHLQAYFRFEALPYLTWSRKTSSSKTESALASVNDQSSETSLRKLAQRVTHVLLAISDGAIESFLKENSFLQEKVCVHFSGALVTDLAASAHPLMTFPKDKTYSKEEYERIPFVIEKGRGDFRDILPGLKNPFFEIDSSLKSRYHAFCVMSGNFTTLLWEKTFAEFQKMGLPKEVLVPYLEQTTRNLALSAADNSVLTGPLARGDEKTINRHLQELGSDPYATVYRAFVQAFNSESPLPGGSK